MPGEVKRAKSEYCLYYKRQSVYWYVVAVPVALTSLFTHIEHLNAGLALNISIKNECAFNKDSTSP